jgi:hypothetical protein
MNERQQGEGGKDSGGEVGQSPMVFLWRDSNPSLGWWKVPHHISVPGRQNGPQGELWPKPEHGQLQSAYKPPCCRVFTPRSSSLELGLILSEHKLGERAGEERRRLRRGEE